MSRSFSHPRPYKERTFRNVRTIEPRNNVVGSGAIFDIQQSANDMLREFLDVMRTMHLADHLPLRLGRPLHRAVRLQLQEFETFLQTLVNGESVFSDMGSLYNRVITRLHSISSLISESTRLVTWLENEFHEIFRIVISVGSLQRRRADRGYDSQRLGRVLYEDEL